MFYTALHAVETLFAADNIGAHPGHGERNNTLKTTNRYKAIWAHYQPLFGAARTCRYDPNGVEWISAQDAKKKLSAYLYRLENSVLKLMGSDQNLGPIWKD